MQNIQKLNDEIGLYQVDLEKYIKLFIAEGGINRVEQKAFDDLQEKITYVKELMLMHSLGEEDNNWRTIIIASKIQSIAIKNKLIEVSKNLAEGEENEEKLKACIADVIQFESITGLMEFNKKEALKFENHIRLILKIITDKKDLVTLDELNTGYAEYLNGKLKLGPDKFENPNGLGSGFKIVPFNNERLQKLLQGNREDDKSLFSKTGKLVWVGRKYPIRIKASLQPFSMSLALANNYFIQGDEHSFFQAARNTTTFSGESMSSALTVASGGLKMDFAWCTFSGKIDLLKFGAETSSKLENIDSPVSAKFELAAVVFQADFGDKQFDLLAQKMDIEGLFDFNKEKITASLKITASFDAFAYSTQKIKDAGEKKAIKDLAKMSKEAVEHADDIIKNVVNNKPRKVSKAAAQRLKDLLTRQMKEKLEKSLKSTAAKELGEKIMVTTGKTIVKKFAKMAATRIILKAIPFVNVISTIWDVCTLGYALFNYFSTTPPLTAQQIQRMEERNNWERLSSKLRDLANEDPLERRYVILKAFSLLSKDGVGLYYFSARIRYDVYLKFYETSATGSDYFRNAGKYKEYFKSEGSEKVGAGVKIAFKIEKEEPTQMDTSDIQNFIASNGGGYEPAYKQMPLIGEDQGEMMMMSDYWVLKERMELVDKDFQNK
jgi:hypothetical protein